MQEAVEEAANWYGAIAEAAARYLSVVFLATTWPRQRGGVGRLSEVEAALAGGFRPLIAAA